ncbi:PIN domain-containing protein [Microaerobacter geothermalis]|nr:PIN domain-containing protein [Microaerobacter geothermalis]
MRSIGYLFDTNIAIGMVDSDEGILEFIKQASRDKLKIYFSVVTECEFISGLSSEHEAQSIKFLNSGRFLEVNSSIARVAGNIRREQRFKRRKLKTPDALIIATAIKHGLILVSRDKDMDIAEEYNVRIIKL